MTDIVSILDEGLGNSSYVVDIGDQRALVLDPERDPGWYLEAAGRRGLRVAYTVETHLHADFVFGSRELAAQGAQVKPHPDAVRSAGRQRRTSFPATMTNHLQAPRSRRRPGRLNTGAMHASH